MFFEEDEDKKKTPAKEQPLWKYLLRMQETPSEEQARKEREAREKRERENIQKAITGFKTLKKVVDDSKKEQKK